MRIVNGDPETFDVVGVDITSTSNSAIENNTASIDKAVLPRAAYSGTLAKFPGAPECHILDDGTAIITCRGMVSCSTWNQEKGCGANDGKFGRYLDRLPPEYAHLSAGPNFRDFVTKDGKTAKGYLATSAYEYWGAQATLLAQGRLRKDQHHIGSNSQRIVAALGKTSIITVIAEATGKLKEQHDKLVLADRSEITSDVKELLQISRENRELLASTNARVDAIEERIILQPKPEDKFQATVIGKDSSEILKAKIRYITNRSTRNLPEKTKSLQKTIEVCIKGILDLPQNKGWEHLPTNKQEKFDQVYELLKKLVDILFDDEQMRLHGM